MGADIAILLGILVVVVVARGILAWMRHRDEAAAARRRWGLDE